MAGTSWKGPRREAERDGPNESGIQPTPACGKHFSKALVTYRVGT